MTIHNDRMYTRCFINYYTYFHYKSESRASALKLDRHIVRGVGIVTIHVPQYCLPVTVMDVSGVEEQWTS